MSWKLLIFRQEGGKKMWCRRFARVYKGNLIYARKQSDKSWSRIGITASTNARADIRRTPKNQICVENAQQGTFYLRADNESEMNAIIAAINDTAATKSGGASVRSSTRSAGSGSGASMGSGGTGTSSQRMTGSTGVMSQSDLPDDESAYDEDYADDEEFDEEFDGEESGEED